MKRTTLQGRGLKGFTLVEMLVVIAIIGILAALLLPALSAAKKHAMIKKAQVEIAGIVSAIHDYESDNSIYPVSKATMAAASANGADDFTFGTANVACAGPAGVNAVGAGFSGPGGTLVPVSSASTPPVNNSEVVAILKDLEKFGNGVATVNAGHVRNPKKTGYLTQGTYVNDSKSPGIGLDGVFRDPWGNPYIITMDLNGDNRARDIFYRDPNVSASQSGPAAQGGKTGLNGLVLNGTYYEANLPVMVWSAGPDKMVDKASAANLGANKDNVLSWKQ